MQKTILQILLDDLYIEGRNAKSAEAKEIIEKLKKKLRGLMTGIDQITPLNPK